VEMVLIKGIRHTGLVVRNIDKSLEFYRDILGLSIWQRKTEEGSFIQKVVNIQDVKLEWVKLEAPDKSVIELIHYHYPSRESEKIRNASSTQLGCSHIAFSVYDISKTFLLIKERGIHYNNPPQLSPDGRAKVMYCHDPDGIIVELVEIIGHS